MIKYFIMKVFYQNLLKFLILLLMMKFLDILINIKILYEFYIYEFFVNFKRLFFNKNKPPEKTHVPLETQRIPRELS